MSAPWRVQLSVLAARYRARTLADWKTGLLLVAQAPFIGWLCTLAWGSIETDTPSLYFVLGLAALWFGCIGACREVVKDRRIIERERLFGLSASAWVLSRYPVLAAIGMAQVVLLVGAVEWQIGMKGALPLQVLALWGASLCGTGLGLLVSGLSSTQERAVGAIPLLILPQILFSEFAIPRRLFGDTMRAIEAAMPVSWCYDVFAELAASQTSWSAVAADLLVLGGIAMGLAGMAILVVRITREST